MTPEQFRAWRKGLKLKQKEAAELLGLKKRMIQYYETGTREGKKVKIPKYIRLACYALSQDIEDFDGISAIALKTSVSSENGNAHAINGDGQSEPKPEESEAKPEEQEEVPETEAGPKPSKGTRGSKAKP